MLQEVYAKKCRSVPRGWIFTHPIGLEEKPRAQVILAMMSLGAEKIDERRETFASQRGERLEIKPTPSKRIETAQWDDYGRGASGKLLDGGLGLDVLWQHPKCRRYPLPSTRGPKQHRGCEKPRHLSSIGARLERNGNLPYREVEPHRRGSPPLNVTMNNPRRTEDWVTSKGNLPRGGEDSHTIS